MSIEQDGGRVTDLLTDQFERCKIVLRPKDGEDIEIGKFHVERRELGRDKRRPDIILWIELEFKLFEKNVKAKMRVPVLIELEKTGYNAAKEDFRAFFSSDGEIELTGIVIGGEKHIRDWDDVKGKYNTRSTLHIRQFTDKEF